MHLLCLIHVAACVVALGIRPTVAKSEVYSRKGYQLTFNDTTDAFNETTQKRMVDTFFTVYPKEVRTYNPAAPRKIIFMVNAKMLCVAASAGGNLVSLNPKYFAAHPNDIDVITHEVCYLRQTYVKCSRKRNISVGSREVCLDSPGQDDHSAALCRLSDTNFVGFISTVLVKVTRECQFSACISCRPTIGRTF